MNFSKRIIGMQESPIRKLTPFAEEAKKNGKKVYHLNIGQPDIVTPVEYFDAIKGFDEKIVKYTYSQGIPELINAIINYYKKYDIYFEEDEILITNGGSEAILFSLIAVADSGDEILIPEPYYTNYNGIATSVDINIKPIQTKVAEGFHLPPKDIIESHITPKTKAILITNPGNPTGVVYTQEEINMLAEIAAERDLFIISDEVYREFVYDGLKFLSIASIDKVKDRVIIIDSISKRFSACGARIGCIASKNKKLINQILKLCQTRLCTPILEQVGATKLYSVHEDYFRIIAAEYEKRRNLVYEKLMEIDGVECQKPKGAFYIMAKLPVDNAEKFAIWLLKDFHVDNETVMFAPGEGFYTTPGLGINEARIAYILNENSLNKAMNILKLAIEKYPYKRER